MTPEEQAKVPFPKYSITNIDKRAAKIMERTCRHVETEPTGECFESLLADIYNCFPPNISSDALYASMLCHAGSRLTRKSMKLIAMRLAGNADKLKKGIPVPPWTQQNKAEWVPVEILRATHARGAKGKPGMLYDYRCLAGSPAGLQFQLFWSWNFIKHMAKKLGFTRHRGKFRNFHMTDGLELVMLRLYLLFDPDLSRDGQPGAYKFAVPSAFLTYNRDILKRRFRVTPCPLGYPLQETRCYDCPVGYLPVIGDKNVLLERGCFAACHPFHYYDKPCPRCSKPCVSFDPAGRGVICVSCERLERRNGQQNEDANVQTTPVATG